MASLRETNQATLVAAFKAGVLYWHYNRPIGATEANLTFLARTCGWHDADAASWLNGFYAAQASQVRP